MTVALPERAERTPRPGASRHDVVVVGGGHNALVAAAYLARAGMHVTLLERLEAVGGAAVSASPFAGVDARLSRYSYLVSLLPYTIVRNLELVVELRSRPVSSYTPVRRSGADTGLLVERRPGAATQDSFRKLTGGEAEYRAWTRFYEQLGKLARALSPTLLNPLLGRGQLEALAREEGAGQAWEWVFEQPIGAAVERFFGDDTVRGVVLTDALIGTDSWAGDASLKQNRCFLYHVMGNGSGEWRVPIGGMGSVTEALHRSAVDAGARILTGVEVTHIEPDAGGGRAEVTYRDREGAEQVVQAGYVLAGVAPAVLTRLLGRGGAGAPQPQGTQLKINMLLDHLPRAEVRGGPARRLRRDVPHRRGRGASEPGLQGLPCRPAAGPAALRGLLPHAHGPLDPGQGSAQAARRADPDAVLAAHPAGRRDEGGDGARGGGGPGRVSGGAAGGLPAARRARRAVPGGQDHGGPAGGAGDARRPHLPPGPVLALRRARGPGGQVGRGDRDRQRPHLRRWRAPRRRCVRNPRPQRCTCSLDRVADAGRRRSSGI